MKSEFYTTISHDGNNDWKEKNEKTHVQKLSPHSREAVIIYYVFTVRVFVQKIGKSYKDAFLKNLD